MSEDLLKAEKSTSSALAQVNTSDAHEAVLTWLNQPNHQLTAAVRELTPEQITQLLISINELFLRQVAKFNGMQEIGSALGKTIQLDELLYLIMEKIVWLMEAEHATLFLIDEATDELWSKAMISGVDTEIRLEPGQGLAGWVARTGTSVNVRDAYNDPRFNPGIDKRTGFTTRNVLCQPVRNQNGKLIGVVQVLNRKVGDFSAQDENLLSAIASQTAIAIEHSNLYLSMMEQNQKLKRTRQDLEHKIRELDLLYDVERALSQAFDLDDLIQTITQKTLKLISARASALTLREDDHNRMFVMVNRAEPQLDDERADISWEYSTRTISQGHGIASGVIQSGEAFLCDRSGCGEVAEAASEEIGLRVESVICVPLFDDEECIGALEVMNRMRPSQDPQSAGQPIITGFSEDDRKVLTLIAAQIATAVTSRRHRQEQQEAERLATIGQMLTSVVHDLKNPIAVISGNAQLMVRADSLEKRKEFAHNINRQFDHLNQMTHELLTFARGESKIALERVDLAEYIRELSELLAHEFKPTGVTFHTRLDFEDGAALTATFDPAKITRAITNLARNAAEAMPEGGIFEIALERGLEPDELRIICRDTGNGIPEGIRDSLFDSFITSGKRHGTGLGLAIVKKIVDEHHAAINFDTEIGHGTSFLIQIPQNDGS